MITIHLEDWEDVEDLMSIFQQIGHHFPCRCGDDSCNIYEGCCDEDL